VRVVLLGPPGAGKGTQAQIIAGHLGVPAISTGDIFRANVSGQTELGKEAKVYMDRGDLVPDDLIVGIVADRLQAPDCANGVLFDGFPRTLPQAEALSRVLGEMGRGEAKVVAVEVPEAELIRRLSGRRTCRGCAHIFHVDSLPEGQAACPDCNGELYQRDDDQAEAIAQRLRVYAKQTEPLLEYYDRRGGLVRVDGTGDPQDVAARARTGLGS
jgi:adenylate kinase